MQRQTLALEGIDASFLYLESAGVAMQTVKVAVFEPGSALDFRFDALREAAPIAAQQLPALRRCLVVVPAWLHHPRWIDVAQLDVDAHLDHIVLEPEAGLAPEAGFEALERLVAEAAERWLPRQRPLWRLSVVTGLHDHRLAAIVTLHHSIADGGAALAMLEVLTQSAPGEWTAPTFYGDPPVVVWARGPDPQSGGPAEVDLAEPAGLAAGPRPAQGAIGEAIRRAPNLL